MSTKAVLDAWLYGKEVTGELTKPERPFHGVLLGERR